MASLVCRDCGEPLREDAQFCPSCGAQVRGQGQETTPIPKAKRPRSCLALALAAGAAAIMVVLILWVGMGKGPVDLEKPSGHESAEAPPPSLEGDESGLDAGDKADSQEDPQKPPEPAGEESEPGEGGADGMGSSLMFQPHKMKTGAGKQAETPKPDPDQAGSTEEETPSPRPDTGALKPDDETTVPAPKQVDTPEQTEAFEMAFSEGLQAARSGNFALAAERFQTAVERSPNSASAWTNLGLAQKRLGDIEGAVSSYQNALKADPHFPLAYKNLGVVLEEKGSHQEAAEAYLKYVELAPQATDAAQVKERAEMLTTKTMKGSEK